jgi:hypothetical protein
MSLTLTASNITLADPNRTITQVAFYVQINGVNTLLATGTQTSQGVWTLNFTVNLAPGSYTLFAQARDSDGVFGDPIALTWRLAEPFPQPLLQPLRRHLVVAEAAAAVVACAYGRRRGIEPAGP